MRSEKEFKLGFHFTTEGQSGIMKNKVSSKEVRERKIKRESEFDESKSKEENTFLVAKCV